MKRSRINICSSTTLPDQRVLAQPQAFRTENVVAASAEDLQKWLFKNWDNNESSTRKLSNLLQERFYDKKAATEGSPMLKLVKKEYRASDQKTYWWELEIVLLLASMNDNNSKSFSIFIREVTSIYGELVTLYFCTTQKC